MEPFIFSLNDTMLTLNIDWPWEEAVWASDFSVLWELEDLGLFPILPLNRYITLSKVPLTKSNLSVSSYTSSFIFKNLNMHIFMNEGVTSCRKTDYLFLFVNRNFGTLCQAYQIFKTLTEFFYAICKGNNLGSYQMGRGCCKRGDNEKHSWCVFKSLENSYDI